MTVEQIAQMLEMPTSFPVLLRAYMPAEIRVANSVDAEFADRTKEILKFVPDGILNLEDGRELPVRDFWLQIEIDKCKHNPVTALKFMDMGNGRYDVAQAFLTTMLESDKLGQDLYYRPTLGNHIIEQVEALAHTVVGKPLKPETLKL
jgi:hypothetical protein